MAEVFISYARVNQGFVRDLNNALQKLKRDTWIDWRSCPCASPQAEGRWRADLNRRYELDIVSFCAAPWTVPRPTPNVACVLSQGQP